MAAYSYEDIMLAQNERIAEEQAAAAAELEAGRLSGDAYRVNMAADKILQLDLQRNALEVRARSYVGSQQAQPQRHPSGLSDREIEIAKASHSGGTPEERIRDYAANKAKYQRMRATGEYRDDQGTVRR